MSAPTVGIKEAQEAFDAVESKLKAMPEEAAAPNRLEIGRGVSMILGVEQTIRGMRDEIREHAPTFDLTHLDELRTAALAAWFLELTETRPTRDVPVLAEEGKELRALLVKGAELLVMTGDFDADQVANIGKSRTHIDIAGELVQLASMFDQVWDEIGGRLPLERSVIDRASELGTELSAAIGYERVNTEASESTVLKRKAVSLLLEHYNEVQAVILYIRRGSKDCERLVPSAFRANFTGRKSKPSGSGAGAVS